MNYLSKLKDIQYTYRYDIPLVMTNSLLLNKAIEIVDLPMKNGGFFHSHVSLPVC